MQATNIIVVFPKMEDAKRIKNMLMRSGIQVTAVCNTGAQALNYADSLNDGIVVSGYQFRDMLFSELHQNLPQRFEMLLLTSRMHLIEGKEIGVVCVPMPVKLYDLVNTIQMMSEHILYKRRKRRERPSRRSPEDKALILKAKEILMNRNHMTEEEAHRYIQKCSMDSCTNMVETAQMILSINR